MKKPLIGINPYYFKYRDSYWNATREKYYIAVWKAGGVPITVHHPSSRGSVQEIADIIDGLIMVGGPDIPSKAYKGENPSLLDDDVMHKDREKFDRSLFEITYQMKKPVLGICVGFQHINIIYGGDLYEDIGALTRSTVDHGEFNGQVSYHDVELKNDSHIYSVLGKKVLSVASAHHQTIRRLGKGLNVSGCAADGLIESIEDSNCPDSFIAVQWHPEIMTKDETQHKLFLWVCSQSLKRKSNI